MKLICLDTETTGFSNEYDRIVEIGCVDITQGWKKRVNFQKYINPKRSVPEVVVKIHGLTETFLKKFSSFEHHIEEFLKFIEGGTLIIHNAVFDMNFLNAELKRYGYDPLQNKIIDTLTLAKEQFPGKKVNLNALKNHFNINIQREYHGALLDSEILAQVYLMMQSKQTSLEIKHKTEETSAVAREKLFSLNKTEITAHERIMNDLRP